MSPVPDPLAWAVDALCLPWEDLNVYAFEPASILAKWWRNRQISDCTRLVYDVRQAAETNKLTGLCLLIDLGARRCSG